MDKGLAELLVGEFVKHCTVTQPDSRLFLDVLASAEVPDSSRFYEELPDKKQLIDDTGSYHYLSLRRVLRNANAKSATPAVWKRCVEGFATLFGIYSSDVLSRRLREDRELVHMMQSCDAPFSLLGKLESYDFDNPGEKLYVVTRPVLVIPGFACAWRVNEWEKANTTYEKEVGVLRRFKRISREKYLTGQ